MKMSKKLIYFLKLLSLISIIYYQQESLKGTLPSYQIKDSAVKSFKCIMSMYLLLNNYKHKYFSQPYDFVSGTPFILHLGVYKNQVQKLPFGFQLSVISSLFWHV